MVLPVFGMRLKRTKCGAASLGFDWVSSPAAGVATETGAARATDASMGWRSWTITASEIKDDACRIIIEDQLSCKVTMLTSALHLARYSLPRDTQTLGSVFCSSRNAE